MFCAAVVLRAASAFPHKAVLSKEHRLCRRQDFKRVYNRGKSAANHFFVLYWNKNNGVSYRVGFSVSKKLGKAVERNHLKRQLRASARQLAASFMTGYDYIIIARISAQKLSYNELHKHLYKLLQNAHN